MASQPLSSIDTSYDVVERWLRESIELGRSFLFDKKEFEKELQRLWETYDFPYHVRETIHFLLFVLSRY